MSGYILDYSKYSVRELVDVYKRIERKKYPEKFKIIKEQIYYKLNLDKSKDLESFEVQNLFERILTEGYPFKQEKIKNVVLGEKINKVSWIFLWISIILFITSEQFKMKNINSLAMIAALIFFTTNLLQSYFTDVIYMRFLSIKKSKSPLTFRYLQFLSLVIVCLGFFILIRWISG